jgi:beta-glucosidase
LCVASGEPSCTNADLFGGVLRRKLGFDGVGATDCGALNDAFMYHRRYVNAADAAAAAVKAGVDSNCGIIFRQALPWAIGNGTLSVAALDASAAGPL